MKRGNIGKSGRKGGVTNWDFHGTKISKGSKSAIALSPLLKESHRAVSTINQKSKTREQHLQVWDDLYESASQYSTVTSIFDNN